LKDLLKKGDRKVDRKRSSRQVMAGQMVSQLRKERLPERMRMPWNPI